MRILPLLILSAVISMTGCAATNQQSRPSYKVVATSSEIQPQWLKAKTLEEAGYMFFVGHADGVRDLSQSEDQAEAYAESLIRSEIREHLRRELEAGPGIKAAGKREALDLALTQGLAALELSGVAPVERYWERVEVPVSDGTAYAYRVALLVRMSKTQFEATRAKVYRAVAKQVGL